MTYYIFLDKGKLNGCGQCPQVTEGVENIEVSEDIYNAYVAESEKYIYSDGEIVKNPNYEDEQAQAREEAFNEEFFNTSLGYVRRKVTMKDGVERDFLSDILSLLQVGVPIITYEAPDFNTSDLPKQKTNQIVTEEFINECKQQVLKDFYGAVAESEE